MVLGHHGPEKRLLHNVFRSVPVAYDPMGDGARRGPCRLQHTNQCLIIGAGVRCVGTVFPFGVIPVHLPVAPFRFTHPYGWTATVTVTTLSYVAVFRLRESEKEL